MSRISRKKQKITPISENQIQYQTGIYVRLSDKEKGAVVSQSIQNQKELLINYINERPELCLKHIYMDDGKSGTNFTRSGFQELIQDIKKGIINCVLVKDLSRFGRNYLETGEYLEYIFPLFQVRFIAVMDAFDTVTASQTEYAYLLPLKNLMNENYARDISRKERTSKEILRKKGCFLGGNASYGYQRMKSNPHILEIDHQAAQVVQEIFHLSEQGYGDQTIATYLNEKLISCPAQYKYEKELLHHSKYKTITKWSRQTIRHIVTNEIYKGCMVQGVQSCTVMKGKKKVQSKDKWNIVEGTHEAIISSEQFERVLKVRKERRQSIEPPNFN